MHMLQRVYMCFKSWLTPLRDIITVQIATWSFWEGKQLLVCGPAGVQRKGRHILEGAVIVVRTTGTPTSVWTVHHTQGSAAVERSAAAMGDHYPEQVGCNEVGECRVCA